MEDFTPVSGTPMPLEQTPPKADDSGWKKGMSLEGHAKKPEKSKQDKPKRSGGTLKTVLFSVAWGIVLSYAVVVSVMYYQDYTARYDAGYDEGYRIAYSEGETSGFYSGRRAGREEHYDEGFTRGWTYGFCSGYAYDKGYNGEIPTDGVLDLIEIRFIALNVSLKGYRSEMLKNSKSKAPLIGEALVWAYD